MATLKRPLVGLALLAAGLVPLSAEQPALSTQELIIVQSVEKAGPPQFLQSRVLFSYKPPEDVPVRLVAARFEHEGYRALHPYFKNENGVFLLLLDVDQGLKSLTYRIVVDGVWMRDPANPKVEEDPFGVEFSVFDLAARPSPPLRSPQISGREVTFWFRARAGRFVAVVGEFNHWDPYWDRMEEPSPGLYRATLRLPPGQHFYAFSVDGERVTDPLNVDRAVDREGFSVSTFALP